MKDIILFGMQGSGKGTQCRNLLSQYGQQLIYFESGNILRALKANDNAIGNYVKSLIDRGVYLPDNFLIGILDLFIQILQPEQAMLMDGFPRRIGQMHMYLDRVYRLNRSLMGIYLNLDEQVAITRLSMRRVCPQCVNIGIANSESGQITCPNCDVPMVQRVDDTPDAIKLRIDQYKQETMPVLDHFRSLGLLYTVDADQSQEQVFGDIVNLIHSQL